MDPLKDTVTTAPVEDGDLTSTLASLVDRLSDRLRSLSDVRLARPLPPHASRADAARSLAQLLADTAADLEQLPRRPLPRLHDLAVGDQVAVTGHDLVAAVRAAPEGRLGGAMDSATLEPIIHACRELAAGL